MVGHWEVFKNISLSNCISPNSPQLNVKKVKVRLILCVASTSLQLLCAAFQKKNFEYVKYYPSTAILCTNCILKTFDSIQITRYKWHSCTIFHVIAKVVTLYIRMRKLFDKTVVISIMDPAMTGSVDSMHSSTVQLYYFLE